MEKCPHTNTPSRLSSANCDNIEKYFDTRLNMYCMPNRIDLLGKAIFLCLFLLQVNTIHKADRILYTCGHVFLFFTCHCRFHYRKRLLAALLPAASLAWATVPWSILTSSPPNSLLSPTNAQILPIRSVSYPVFQFLAASEAEMDCPRRQPLLYVVRTAQAFELVLVVAGASLVCLVKRRKNGNRTRMDESEKSEWWWLENFYAFSRRSWPR